MKNTNMTSKWGCTKQFLIALFLLSSPLAGAYAACCAGHGGVASCNKSTGYQMCKDGTASPTCKCKKEKTTKPTATKKTTTKQVPATSTKKNPATTTTTTTKPKKHWWSSGKSNTNNTNTPASTTKNKSTTTPASSGTSAKGCCSRHGGVAQCNKSTGYQMCKDGSQSATCTCH